MHFLSEFGLFFAKTITTVIAFIVIFAVFFSFSSKGKQDKGKLQVKKINKKLKNLKEKMNEETLSDSTLKRLKKQKKKDDKNKKDKKNKNKVSTKRLFVINFVGDMVASAAKTLSEEVTAILLTATSEDEVLVKLNSPGGVVNAYGLATSQLQRIKDANIRLTVAVDKMAASGGYMMACVADHLLAAPFAIIGSIGVVVQLPNFHKLLEKNDIDYEMITAGNYKRTLTMLGKNTEEGREKMKDDVDTTHELFKQHIVRYRPELDISRVATGEHWFAVEALDLKLVDALQTSDDYILQKKDTYSIFELHTEQKKSLMKQLMSKGSLLMDVFFRQRGGQDYLQ